MDWRGREMIHTRTCNECGKVFYFNPADGDSLIDFNEDLKNHLDECEGKEKPSGVGK